MNSVTLTRIEIFIVDQRNVKAAFFLRKISFVLTKQHNGRIPRDDTEHTRWFQNNIKYKQYNKDGWDLTTCAVRIAF